MEGTTTMDEYESLQQLSQLFQDDDPEAILSVLADLEAKNPVSPRRTTAEATPPASRQRQTEACLPTAVMSGGILNQPPVKTADKGKSAADPTAEGSKSHAATAAVADNGASTKPTAPFFYYKDYSREIDPDPNVPVTAPGRIPNFPAKMYAILSRTDLQDIVSWLPHGRSWKVHKPREFEVKVIPSYFEHSKYSSFIRQANGWGFRRMISKGPNRNSYYHEMFLRSVPHMLKTMKRPLPSSKPLADASTEPDLFKISELFPLSEMKDGISPQGLDNFFATPQGPSHNAYIEAHEQHAASMRNLQQQHHQQHPHQHQHPNGLVHEHHRHRLTHIGHPETPVVPSMLPPGVKAKVTPAPLSISSNHRFPPPSREVGGSCPAHCCKNRHCHSNVVPPPASGHVGVGRPPMYDRHHHDHLRPLPPSSSSRHHEDSLEPVPAFGPSTLSSSVSVANLELPPILNDVFDGVSGPIDDSFWLA